jgi:predicted ATPase
MTRRPLDPELADLGGATVAAPVALGRYDVVGRLGHGGMGTVYEAVDRERGTRVALKTLSFRDATRGVWLKREFRVVADLVHENLAPVYELGSDGDLWFFTMELIDGVRLSRWARPDADDGAASALPVTRTVPGIPEDAITRESPGASRGAGGEASRGEATRTQEDVLGLDDPALAEPVVGPVAPPTREMAEIRRVFAEIVHGVSALHDAGLRHGDIKPANVLVRDDGRVVLVDFGLARPVRERHEVRAPSGGTPTFMAPEQFGGDAVGPEADWYAVGATLYRILTGRLPYAAGSLIDLYVRKLHQPPIEAHLLWDGAPRDLSELCGRLLAPDPPLRPGRDELLRVFGGSAPASVGSAERATRRLLVGREAELYALERAYGAARAGTPMLAHVHGASGIGKSALLGSFLDAVHEVDGALVLRGRCYERESVPYKGFDRIVDDLSERLRRMDLRDLEEVLPAWSGELGRAFPALAAVPAVAARAAGVHVAHDAIELRRRAWSALGQLLAALGKSRPVVLAIDDVQWIDEDSAGLLDALLRAPRPATQAPGGAPPSSRGPSLMVVLLFRPVSAADHAAMAGHFALARSFQAASRLVDLPLAPLSEAEAEELAEDALRHAGVPDPRSRAAALAQEARGVPFFIEELAHFAGARGPDLRGTSVSLEEAIQARIAALPADQRAIVEVVSIAASPLPQRVVFEAAGVDPGALPALLALRRASLVGWLGAGGDATVSTYHDRIREAVSRGLDERARLSRHLAIGRALARTEGDTRGLVFETVRHLAAAAALIEDANERMEVARLHAEAGERAHRAAAFPLAFDCFEAGIALLPGDAWHRDHALALRLHVGATEAAYLTASWAVLDARIADVKAHARTPLEALVAWQTQIDACVGRHQYLAAVDAALDVLAQLDVRLPRDPGAAEIGAGVRDTLEQLTAIGPEGLHDRPDLDDPRVVAATEILMRVSPAAYFGKPTLLPVIACHLVRSSIERGVSAATPYALALFGIVLNTIGEYPVAHVWGQLALRLLDRFPWRRHEAATRHIVHDLVCCWMVPLGTVLDPLRRVFDLGCQTGDYEYASYAAHGYVHNAMYAGRPLGPLCAEARQLGTRCTSTHRSSSSSPR